jgi:hypothetical protein
MTSLSDRLIFGLRAREYGLERAPIVTVNDGLVWMRGTHPGYSAVWFGPNDSDAGRRRTIRCWLWLRWVHRKDWFARGGREP